MDGSTRGHGSTSAFGYQPALDGLRAVAVCAVIAYHLQYGWAEGGFLGVDAFFVLSGFLITSLLVVEFGGAGRIDLRAFWVRRARRLLPALFLVLGAITVWAAFVLRADQLGTVRGDGLATIFYGANWRFVASGQSYFDLVSVPSPFRHAWSLAIEEQFYLVWPLVAFACLRLGRGRTRVLATVCTVGAAASIALMAIVYDPLNPSRAYYGTDTRAHALLIGALLAILLRHRAANAAARVARRGVNPALQTAGVGAALACVAAFAFVPDTSSFMYRGGFALFAIAVAVLIAAAVAPGRSPVRTLLSIRPLRWIGAISYGLYLWHWPVQVALTAPRTGLDGAALDVVRIAATFGLATLSFYAVEQPIRRGALGRATRAVTPIAFAGVITAVFVVTAAAVPAPSYLRNTGDTSIKSALRGLKGHEVAATPSSAPAGAAAATAPPTAPPGATVTFAPHRILLVGDSVMASLLPGLESAAAERGLELASIAVPGCGTITGEPVGPGDIRFSWAAGCGENIPGIQSRAVDQYRPDLVVWLSSWESADRIVDGQMVRMRSADGFKVIGGLLDQAVTRLTATGARVAFLTMPQVANSPDLGTPSDEIQLRYELLDELLRNYSSEHPQSTFVVDLAEEICPGGPPCPEEIDGIRPRPNDGHHFSHEGADWIAPWLLDRLTRTARDARGALNRPGGQPAATSANP